jgi:excisionase family DNA binding protein
MSTKNQSDQANLTGTNSSSISFIKNSKEYHEIKKEFLNYNEASFLTSIPLSTLRKKVSSKQIPFIKIGKSVYFSIHELVDWVNSHREGDCHD